MIDTEQKEYNQTQPKSVSLPIDGFGRHTTGKPPPDNIIPLVKAGYEWDKVSLAPIFMKKHGPIMFSSGNPTVGQK